MTGKAVMRTLLIIALIVTAHAVKPFSIKNVTNHLLYSTRSFKFVLPVRLRDNFDHANFLAINLSNSLFEAGKGVQQLARDTVADLALMPIKVQPLDEVNKSATRPKTKPKQSAPAKRINRSEKGDSSDLIAAVNSDEILPVELPPAPAVEATSVVTPFVQPCLAKLFTAKAVVNMQPQPLKLLLEPPKSDCEKREAATVRLIALIEEARKLKATIQLSGKTKAEKARVIASECKERETEVVAEELEIEVAEPEEETPEPEAAEEQKPASPLSPPIERCIWEL